MVELHHTDFDWLEEGNVPATVRPSTLTRGESRSPRWLRSSVGQVSAPLACGPCWMMCQRTSSTSAMKAASTRTMAAAIGP
jgi:hypothetical protein